MPRRSVTDSQVSGRWYDLHPRFLTLPARWSGSACPQQLARCLDRRRINRKGGRTRDSADESQDGFAGCRASEGCDLGLGQSVERSVEFCHGKVPKPGRLGSGPGGGGQRADHDQGYRQAEFLA